MKKLIVLIVIVALQSSYLRASDYFTLGGFKYEIISGDCIRISSAFEDSTFILGNPVAEIVIPSVVSHNGTKYTVKEIQGEVFGINNDIRKIVIEDGIEKIDRYAFAGCLSLESISIPASVTKIEESIFYGCDNLREIKVDKDNPRYDSRDNCNAIIISKPNTLIEGCYTTVIPGTVRYIDGNAFNCCNRLTKLVIPEGVEELGRGAVRNCQNLKSVYISSTVNEILDNVFGGCSNLTEIVVDANNKQYDSRDNSNGIFCDDELVLACAGTTIPKSVKRIDRNPFINISSVLYIPEGIEEIGETAFRGQENIKMVILPKSLKSIGYGVFEGCRNLKVVGFAGSLEEIPMTMFRNCSKLESINIPLGVTKIDKEAFMGCTNLKSIVLPSTVKELGKDAFRNAPCEEEVIRLVK